MGLEEIEKLAAEGVHLDITSKVSLSTDSLEQLIRTTVKNDGHLIISAGKYQRSLQRLAELGGNNLTIKF